MTIIMKICKKDLYYDIVIFMLGIVSLIIVKFLISLGIATMDNYITNVVIAVILIIFLILNIIICGREKNIRNALLNGIIVFILFIIYYIVYCLPIFSFVGCKGVNNTVCLTFLLLLATRSTYYRLLVLRAKVEDVSHKSRLLQSGINTLNNTKYNYELKILPCFIFIGFIFSIVLVIVNTIFNEFDISIFYQSILLQFQRFL